MLKALRCGGFVNYVSAYIFILFTLYLNTEDVVSARVSCVISPNLTSLIVADRLLQDVELHCQCMDDNGIITKPSWFFGGSLVNTQESVNDDVASWRQHIYYINTVPNTLMVKRVFSMHRNGIYTCAPTSTSHTRPSADTITLTAKGKYIF